MRGIDGLGSRGHILGVAPGQVAVDKDKVLYPDPAQKSDFGKVEKRCRSSWLLEPCHEGKAIRAEGKSQCLACLFALGQAHTGEAFAITVNPLIGKPCS